MTRKFHPLLVLAGAGVCISSLAGELRDPTLPVLVASDPGLEQIEPDSAAPIHLTLSYIRIGRDTSHALINGQLLGVGDNIGQAVIASINADHVQLEHDGQRLTLRLYETRATRTLAQSTKSASPSAPTTGKSR